MQLHILLAQTVLFAALPYILWKGLGVGRWVPLVVLQITIGILLGPSVLGRFSPEVHLLLFPKANMPALGGIANLAAVLVCALAGIHMNTQTIDKAPGGFRALFIVSALNFLLPMLGCMGLGVFFNSFAGPKASPFSFSLGVGMVCAATALPVLYKILEGLGLLKQRSAVFAIGCAVVCDLILWPILSFTTMESKTGATSMSPVFSFAILGLLVFLLWALNFWLKKQWLSKQKTVSESNQFLLVLATLLVSAAVTEYIGLHAAIGAVFAGMAIPHLWGENFEKQINLILSYLLLPFFFLLAGQKAIFDVFSGEIWGFAAIMIFASTFLKLASATIPYKYLTLSSWSEAVAFGALTVPKGLIDLIIALLLFDAGVFSQAMLSATILMIIVTTGLAAPLNLLFSRFASIST